MKCIISDQNLRDMFTYCTEEAAEVDVITAMWTMSKHVHIDMDDQC